jgi:WhiB family redox-sensing transcriptional regulator
MSTLARWRDRAACYGLGSLFDSLDAQDQRDARAICDVCPVRVACQSWVSRLDEADDPGGVCGGWTEAQRIKARRRQAQLKQPPAVTVVAKQCWLCHHLKQPDDFYRNSDSPDGLRNECRDCYDARRAGKKATA